MKMSIFHIVELVADHGHSHWNSELCVYGSIGPKEDSYKSFKVLYDVRASLTWTFRSFRSFSNARTSFVTLSNFLANRSRDALTALLLRSRFSLYSCEFLSTKDTDEDDFRDEDPGSKLLPSEENSSSYIFLPVEDDVERDDLIRDDVLVGMFADDDVDGPAKKWWEDDDGFCEEDLLGSFIPWEGKSREKRRDPWKGESEGESLSRKLVLRYDLQLVTNL